MMLSLMQLLTKEFERSFNTGVGEVASAATSSEPGKKLAGVAWDNLAPIPLQAALYSPEAEAAFIGPKGMARLKGTEFEKAMQPFISRVFGQRAEISPSDAANVWWRMGSTTSKMDNFLIEKKAAQEELAKHSNRMWSRGSSKISPGEQTVFNKLYEQANKQLTLPDLMAQEEFPALFAAYPELRRLKVDIKTGRQGQVAGEYLPNTGDRLKPNEQKILNKAMNNWRARNTAGTPTAIREHAAAYDKFKAMLIDRRPGSVMVALPDEMAAATPSADIMETLLHEVQHFIQRTESGTSGKGFISRYNNATKEAADNVRDSLTQRKLDISYGKGSVYDAMDKAEAFRPAGQGLEWKADTVQLDDIKLRNWIDSLGWREKSRVQGEFSGDFWPPSAYNYEVFKRNNKDLNPPDLSVYNPSVKEFYAYKMNPYEREAFEASRRDIEPQYRNEFARKLEEYTKKK